MSKILPQHVHREICQVTSGIPDDWRDLDEQQQAIFTAMAKNLNAIASGEVVGGMPTRRALVSQHKRALDALRDTPVQIGDQLDRFLAKSLDDGMKQYHEFALDYLQSGGDIANTLDALTEDELLDKMRAEGFYACFNEDIGA